MLLVFSFLWIIWNSNLWGDISPPFHSICLLVVSAEFDLAHWFFLSWNFHVSCFMTLFFILVSFWPLWQFLCSLTFCSLPLPLLTLKHLLFFIGPCSRPFSLLPLPTWGISAIPAASMHQWILMMQMYVASSYVSPVFCAQIQATPNSTPSSPSSRPPPFRPAPKPPFSSSEELRPLIRHLQTSFCFRG